MKNIKYVVISDLHLGAPNNILTKVSTRKHSGEIKPDPDDSTASLDAFAKALLEFIPTISDRHDPPTLILLGDVLDLGFTPVHQVVMAYQRFIEKVFPDNGYQVFSKDILFVPGNHDHALWQGEKTQHFINQIKENKISKVPALSEVTKMMHLSPIVCQMLTGIMQEYSHLKGYQVKINYPNVGFMNKDRVVFLHHGHFIESIYRMMSEIGLVLFDESMNEVDVAEIERVNGTWIDFIWSSLGNVGDNSFNLYSLMQDGAALHEFTSSLAKKIEAKLLQFIPMNGLAKVQELSLGLTKGVLDAVIGRASELERNSYRSVLSGDGLEGLKWYINKVISHQFSHEKKNETMPLDVSFVLGHTHKPFEDQLSLTNYQFPVKVYNTGGWVLDVPTMVATQGASMVLIDNELHVASMRLFNDPVNEIMNPVTVNGVGGFPDEKNPLLPFLKDKLVQHKAIWDSFSKAVKKDIDHRAEIMQHQYFNPASSAPPHLTFD